jgi:hypothetical protein
MTNEELKAENERLTRHLAGLKKSCDLLVQSFGALAKATPDVRLRPTLERAVSHAKQTLKAIELAATPNEPPPEVVEAGMRMLEAIQGAQDEHREMAQALHQACEKLEEAQAAALYYGEHHVLCKCDRETKSKVHDLCTCGFSEFLCGFGLNEFARVHIATAQGHLAYGAEVRRLMALRDRLKQLAELHVKDGPK